MKKKIYIDGMTCEHCLKRVKTTLEEMENVKNAEVNLADGYAIIEMAEAIGDSLITEVIDEAGYDVTKIEEVI